MSGAVGRDEQQGGIDKAVQRRRECVEEKGKGGVACLHPPQQLPSYLTKPFP